jgi:hypothetical protein
LPAALPATALRTPFEIEAIFPVSASCRGLQASSLRSPELIEAMHGFRQMYVRAGRYGEGFVSSPISRFARSLTSEIRDSDGDEELDAASVSL